MINDIHIGPITIHMYGIMIAIGVCLAVIVSSYRAKKKGMDEDIIYNILVCSLVGGFLGTRILYYFTVLPEIIKDPSILWNFREGYVVYGGIIGGVLGNIIYFKKVKKAFLPYFDLIIPQVALAQAIGRIGCFFSGCCYGRETDLPIAITYTQSKYAPNNVSLMPTQLISSLGDFCIFVFLIFYSRRKKADGTVGAMYCILYSIGRFLVEFLRNDYRGNVGILSTSQFIAIACLGAGIALHVVLGKVNNKQKE